MSEPKAIATTIESVVPGVWRWTVQDDRIGYEGDAHAVASHDRIVLIDPLRVETGVLERLGQSKLSASPPRTSAPPRPIPSSFRR